MADDIIDTEMTGTDDNNNHRVIHAVKKTSQSSNSITVAPPIPYTFDLGNLLVLDMNPLPPQSSYSSSSTSTNLNQTLTTTARSCAQSLLNQLLVSCPIHSTPTGAILTLPPSTTPLPREKPVPKPKTPTRWETFAARKGIASKERKGKMVYDEEKGEWVPKWGYKGINKAEEGEWLVEVDNKEDGGVGLGGNEVGKRKGSKDERKERVRRNERRMRANEKRSRKVERLKGGT